MYEEKCMSTFLSCADFEQNGRRKPPRKHTSNKPSRIKEPQYDFDSYMRMSSDSMDAVDSPACGIGEPRRRSVSTSDVSNFLHANPTDGLYRITTTESDDLSDSDIGGRSNSRSSNKRKSPFFFQSPSPTNLGEDRRAATEAGTDTITKGVGGARWLMHI
jgi:hypothetical protein